MRILETLAASTTPLPVREVAARVRLPRPTVYRLLETLESHGLVVAGADGVAIGHAVLTLAAHRLEQLELRVLGRPFLVELSRAHGETAHMGLLEQGRVVYIDKVDSIGPLRMASAVGKIMPAHCTALGKAMLAYLSPARVQGVLDLRGLPRHTPNTIVHPEQILRELTLIRSRGYALDNVENEEGVRCVGAPVFDHRGEVAGAISLSGSVHTITMDRVRRILGPAVREVAERISVTMGWTRRPQTIG